MRRRGSRLIKKASDIILSGLIFNLDSVEPDSYNPATPNKWTDLIGGIEATIIADNYFNVNENAIPLDVNYEYLNLGSTLSIPSGDFTMSVYMKALYQGSTNRGFFRDGSSSNGSNFFITDQAAARPWVRIAGTDILKPTSGYSLNDDENTNIYISYIFKNYIDANTPGTIEVNVNGVTKHIANHSKLNTGFLIYKLNYQFSGANNVRQFSKAWHFYNKALTNEEILNNLQAMQYIH